MHVDYSVKLKWHSGHDIFYIFMTCCYLRDADGKLVNKNVTVMSEVGDYSRVTVFSCENKVLTFICEKHNPPLTVTLNVWSDSYTGQF